MPARVEGPAVRHRRRAAHVAERLHGHLLRRRARHRRVRDLHPHRGRHRSVGRHAGPGHPRPIWSPTPSSRPTSDAPGPTVADRRPAARPPPAGDISVSVDPPSWVSFRLSFVASVAARPPSWWRGACCRVRRRRDRPGGTRCVRDQHAGQLRPRRQRQPAVVADVDAVHLRRTARPDQHRSRHVQRRGVPASAPHR